MKVSHANTMTQALALMETDRLRLGLAVHFLVEGMRTFAANAVVPTMKQIADGYIEACEPIIPIEVTEMLAIAERQGKEG